MNPNEYNSNSYIDPNEQLQPAPIAPAQPVYQSAQSVQPVEPTPVPPSVDQSVVEKQEPIVVGSDLNLDTQTTVDFGDENGNVAKQDETPETVVDIDKLASEYSRNNDVDHTEVERCPAIPLSKLEDLNNYARREIADDPGSARDRFNNPEDDLAAVGDAMQEFTNARKQQLDSLKKTKVEQLAHHVGGIGETRATIKSRFKDKDILDVSGDDGRIVFASVLGSGMRRIPLWNSGITITLRPLSLDILHQYYLEVNHVDYEYGKEFGYFYYLFSDLTISEYIINRLLPVAICGSSYVNWQNMDSLLSVISFQDYPTILWAMAMMMYPNGADIRYVCAEPNCGHVTREKVDLSKLRLINKDLLTDEMIEHFKSNRKLTDEDVAKYKAMLPISNKIEFSYGDEGTTAYRKWTIFLKQPSLLEWRAVGRDYNKELRKNAEADSEESVTTYMFYNFYRCYKPWIEKIQVSLYVDKETVKTISVSNDGTTGNNLTIYDCLNDLQASYRPFEKLIQSYIEDSQISHICFYFPKCPKCGTEPATSYHGYIPYDPQKAFFILALMKLVQGASRSVEQAENDQLSTSIDTQK